MDQYQNDIPGDTPQTPLPSGVVVDTIASALEQSPPDPRPWGGWATVGWTVLVLLVSFAIQIAVVFVIAFAIAVAGIISGTFDQSSIQSLDRSPWVLAGCSLFTFPVTMVCVWLVVKLRKWQFGDYLNLGPYKPAGLFLALIATALFMAIEVIAAILTDQPESQFMLDMFSTPMAWPLVLLIVIIAAPIGEEVLFRGFMFRGLAASRVGAMGAIILTSLVWTSLHIQYGMFEISFIFILGLLLGYVRFRSGSTWPPIIMHMVFNAIASVIAIWSIFIGGEL